jgi:hypothetical protein
MFGGQPHPRAASIYSKFVDAMAEKAKTITLGPGMNRETKMGPPRQPRAARPRAPVPGHWQTRSQTATGGGRRPACSTGDTSSSPHGDVDNSARIAREEIFGLVASVIPFDDEEDALRIATTRTTVWLRPYGRATSSGRCAVMRFAPHCLSTLQPTSEGAMGRLRAERHRPRTRQGASTRFERQARLHQPVGRSVNWF